MNKKNIIFKLKNGLAPISWQLPYSNLLLPRKLEDGTLGPDKRIHYIPGAPSIYKDDYKGDDEATQIIFEDGELEVRPSDVLLLEICRRHPWMNIWYEEVNAEAEAAKKLEDFQLRDIANEKLNGTGDIELQAIALAVIGASTSILTANQCKAQLKEIAYTDPNRLLTEMDNPNYANKYLAALAMLKGVIKVNESNTAIVWAKIGGGMITRVAVGEDPLNQMAEFLSGTSDEVAVTMQKIGEAVGQVKKEETKIVAAPVVEEKEEVVLTETAEAMEARISAALSEKYKDFVPAGSVEAIKPLVEEKAPIVPAVTVDANADATSDKSEEKNNDNTKVETLVFDPAKEYELADLQKLYPVVVGADLPMVKKNDAAWLLKKIVEVHSAK